MSSHAPERYILGELTPPERDDFETHLADCTVCMQELHTADIFAANASAVFAARAALPARAPGLSFGFLRGFLRARPFPVLVFSGALNFALIAFVAIGLRSAARPGLQPGLVDEFTVHPPSRSEAQVCPVNSGAAFAMLQFDLPRRYERYEYSLEGSQASLAAPPAANAETLRLAVPISGLKPGDHKFRLNAWDGQAMIGLGECLIRIPTHAGN